MFYNSTFNGDISNWKTGSVTNMYGMFWNATSFNQNLSGWNVSSVKNCTGFSTNAGAAMTVPNFDNC
jgi:surface protein